MEKHTKPDDGLVIGSNGKKRTPRADDAGRVECRNCTTERETVYCAAISTRGGLWTYYRCNVCGKAADFKRPHYKRLKHMSGVPVPDNFDARA